MSSVAWAGDADRWQLEVAPYVWIPGAQGRVSIGSRSFSYDSSVRDTLRLLGDLDAGGAMVHMAARRGRLGAYTDFVFLATETTSAFGAQGRGRVRAKLLEYIVSYGATFRLLEVATTLGHPIVLELLAGARWNRISTEVSAERLGVGLKTRLSFTDPVVGGQFRVPLFAREALGRISFFGRADIGGFGAGSDLAWNAAGGLAWHMPWSLGPLSPRLAVGYKMYSFRVSNQVGPLPVSLNVQTGGPVLGVAFFF